MKIFWFLLNFDGFLIHIHNLRVWQIIRPSQITCKMINGHRVTRRWLIEISLHARLAYTVWLNNNARHNSLCIARFRSAIDVFFYWDNYFDFESFDDNLKVCSVLLLGKIIVLGLFVEMSTKVTVMNRRVSAIKLCAIYYDI